MSKKQREDKYTIETRLTQSDRERLDKMAKATGRTRCDLLREAVLFWLDRCEGKQLDERDMASLQMALRPVMKAMEAMNERQCSLMVRLGLDVGTQLALISSRIDEPERKEIMNQAKRYAAVRFQEKLANIELELKQKLARLFPGTPAIPATHDRPKGS